MSSGRDFQLVRDSLKALAAPVVAHALAFLPGTITAIPDGYTPPPDTVTFGSEGGGWTIQSDPHTLTFVALFGARSPLTQLPAESYIVFSARDWHIAVSASHKRLFGFTPLVTASTWQGSLSREIEAQADDEMRGFLRDMGLDADS